MRETGPSTGATIAVGLGFVALFMAISGGLAKAGIDLLTVHVKAGKRYHFFFKTVPAVPQDQLDKAVFALTAGGATHVDSSTSATETRVSYELTPTVNKDIVLNAPMVEFGGFKLIPLKIQELS
jgi:hypothetical protein